MNKSTPATFSIILFTISSAMILSLFGCFSTESEKEENLPLLNYNRCMVKLNFHGHFMQTLHVNNSTSNVDWDEEWGGEYSIAIGSFDGTTFTGSWNETDNGERTWGSVTVVLFESEDELGDVIYDQVFSVEWTENFTYSHDGAAGSEVSTFSGSNLPWFNPGNNNELSFWDLEETVCTYISSITNEIKGPAVDFSLQNNTCNSNSEFEIKFYTE